MGAGKTDAIDGPCTSNRCQFNWVAFEVSIPFHSLSTILKNSYERILWYLVLFVDELKLYTCHLTLLIISIIINNKIFISNNIYISFLIPDI